MRVFVAVAAVVVLAGCSNQTGTAVPVKAGCGLFDKQAVATALKTTEPVVERRGGADCLIEAGAVSAVLTTAPDSERTGYAHWRQMTDKPGEVWDLSPAGGDKAFFARTAVGSTAVGAVLHEGTFYRIDVIDEHGDAAKAAKAFVDVLETAL
jgi:hypothetical protein